MSMFLGRPRNVDVLAAEDSLLALVRFKDLLKLNDRNPDVGHKVRTSPPPFQPALLPTLTNPPSPTLPDTPSSCYRRSLCRPPPRRLI
eukprot:82255-Prorocentrum_minimum.AAC.1